MRVTIISAFNKRPAISRILINTHKRLCADLNDEIGFCVAVTEQCDVDLCEQFGLTYIIQPNDPRQKFNAALTLAYEQGYDAFLIMGDDDSISTDGFNLVRNAIASGAQYAGFKSNYFCDILRKKAMKHTQPYVANKLIGAGRMLSRFAVEAMMRRAVISWRKTHLHYQLGDEIEVSERTAEYLQGYGYAKIKERKMGALWQAGRPRGLDHDSELNLVMNGFAPIAVDDKRIHISDFKSNPQVNIWSYSILEEKCRVVHYNEPMWFMSEEERTYISTVIV